MTGTEHLSRETLVRAFDGELSTAERLEMSVHLSQCEQCLDAFDQVSDLSNDIARLVDGIFVASPRQARERLAEKLITTAAPHRRNRRSKVIAWAAAVAAIVALAVGLGIYSVTKAARSHVPVLKANADKSGMERAAGPADMSFIRLPYSNPALALESEQIVRVNMRLSDLASAGVVRMTTQGTDAWVEADVLLGMDGEPYGIHVLENAPGN